MRYTRDGSYLRLLERDLNGNGSVDSVEVEFPDGTVKVFDPDSGNLLTIRNRFGSFMSITYLTSAAGTPCTATPNFVEAWQITDSESARTNYVCFAEQPTYFDSTYAGQVERVVLAAPPDPTTGAARTATYRFTYLLLDIARGCHSQYTPDTAVVDDVPMLSSIIRPDGSTFGFSYNQSNTNAVCETGTLAIYTLPTGASVDYVYRYWWLPVEQCGGPGAWWIKEYPGIGTRTFRGPRLESGAWTYSSTFSTHSETTICADDESPQPLRRQIPSEDYTVTVTDPLGSVTEYFYSTWPMSPELMWDANGNQLPPLPDSPRGFKKNEYGLPFTRRPGTDSGGKLLSRRVYSASGYAANPKTPFTFVLRHLRT